MKFETPAIEVLKIAVKDVIATSTNSGGDANNGGTGGQDNWD